MITNQAYLFLIFAINGVIIGLLFDFFRILRRSFKTSDLITYIEDIIFWILTGFIILYSTFIFNNGEIRLFMFLGVLLGTAIYMMFISTYFIKINVKIITCIKTILKKVFGIIMIPFCFAYRLLKGVLFKPVNIIIINVRKIFTKLGTKRNLIPKKTKKLVKN